MKDIFHDERRIIANNKGEHIAKIDVFTWDPAFINRIVSGLYKTWPPDK